MLVEVFAEPWRGLGDVDKAVLDHCGLRVRTRRNGRRCPVRRAPALQIERVPYWRIARRRGSLGRGRTRIFDPAPSADHKCASSSAVVAGSALAPSTGRPRRTALRASAARPA